MLPLASIRASLWFKQTRVGQGIDALVRKLQDQPRSPEDWGGMEMLLENKVRRTDPRLESIEARFETNLKSILDAGRRAGAKVVLCTVGVNVRDCAPFASLHTLNLAPAQLASWEHEFQSGLALQNQGDPAGALEHYRRALRIDAEHADLLYRTALCLEAVGDAAESGRYFRSALDADVLRFRADARLNAIVRHSAEGRAEVRLFDAEAALARQSPGGITGGDFFYDHVHLTPSGNYHLARGIASEVATLLELAPEPAGESGWPSESACLRWLGLTERNEVSMLTKVLRRRASPPFSTQLNHAAEVRRLQEMLAGYPQATTASAMSTMARDLAELVSSRPNDADLRSNYASMLQALGRTEEAVREWQEVCRLLPHAVQARIALGLLWERQGGREEAAAQYRECLRLSPLHPQARDRLEQLLPPTVQ